MKQTDLIARVSRHALLCGLGLGLAGLAGCGEPDILPGIPADARLIDLDEMQRETFCRYGAELDGMESAIYECTDGGRYEAGSIALCVSSLGRLRELEPDCPTLARSELNFRRHIAAHCHEPGFYERNFDGQRGCRGP